MSILTEGLRWGNIVWRFSDDFLAGMKFIPGIYSQYLTFSFDFLLTRTRTGLEILLTVSECKRDTFLCLGDISLYLEYQC